MIRFARVVLADVGLGQLRQPDRQVDVRSWPIGVPVPAVAVERRLIDPSAEMEVTVEILRTREACAEAAEPAPSELRGGNRGAETECGGQGDDQWPTTG